MIVHEPFFIANTSYYTLLNEEHRWVLSDAMIVKAKDDGSASEAPWAQ